MRVPLFVLLVLPLLAQPVPEVRGTVVETGSTTPIPGVTVSLNEFGPNADNFIVSKVVVSTVTDGNGVFILRPGHLGEFRLEAKKEGYNGASGAQYALTAAVPMQTAQVSMVRPGTLTGRVIDQEGNAVANLRLMVEGVPARASNGAPVGYSPSFLSTPVITNAEGVFAATGLQPGGYRVHVVPKPPKGDEDLLEYSEAEFKVVDEDVEPSYWPGGVPEASMVLPITVAGGAIANAGTITVRKVTYYRVRLTLNRDCEANERWILRMRPADDFESPQMDRYTACRRGGLLTGVPAGNYDLAIWRGRDVERWARVSVVVTKENTSAPIAFNESASASGRVLAAENADLAKLGPVQILLRSSEGLPSSKGLAMPDEAGRFAFASVPWQAQWLSVQPMNPDTYVKDVRYNGLPLRSQRVDAIPGANIDILLDSGAAKLTANFKNGEAKTMGRLLLFSASVTEPPRLLGGFPPFILMGAEERTGESATVASIPPGDYRMLAMPFFIDEDFRDPNAIAQRFARAEKITLGRGEQKTIELQVK
jgi:hypothetical protein